MRFDTGGLGGGIAHVSSAPVRIRPISSTRPATSRWRRGRLWLEHVSLVGLLLLIGSWAGVRLESTLLGLVTAGLTFLILSGLNTALSGAAPRSR